MEPIPLWYVFVHEAQYGPITLTTLTDWIRDGRVRTADQVWDFVGERWLPAGQFPELAELFPPADAAESAPYTVSIPAAAALAGTKVYFASYRESRGEQRYLRIPVCLSLTYQELNPCDGSLVSRPATTHVENVSPGGLAFIVDGKRMSELTRLRLQLELPGGRHRPVTILGEITRVVNYPGGRTLVGVGFRETNRTDQDRLFAYLRQLVVAQGPTATP